MIALLSGEPTFETARIDEQLTRAGGEPVDVEPSVRGRIATRSEYGERVGASLDRIFFEPDRLEQRDATSRVCDRERELGPIELMRLRLPLIAWILALRHGGPAARVVPLLVAEHLAVDHGAQSRR